MLLMELKVVLHLSIQLNHNDGSREASPGACSIRQQGPSSTKPWLSCVPTGLTAL